MKIELSDNRSELMGLFGLSWPEKVASMMNKQLKGTELAKKLKNFWQPGGLNTKTVENLHREYMALMASGKAPSNFSVQPGSDGSGGVLDQSTIDLSVLLQQKTNIETPIVLAFLHSLFVLARDGKIPFQKWNPKGYTVSTALQKTFKTEQGFLDTVGETKNYMKIFVALAAVGVSAYLLSQIKEFKQ